MTNKTKARSAPPDKPAVAHDDVLMYPVTFRVSFNQLELIETACLLGASSSISDYCREGCLLLAEQVVKDATADPEIARALRTIINHERKRKSQ